MDLTGLGGMLSSLYKTIREDRDLERWWRFSVSCGLTILIVFPFVAGTTYMVIGSSPGWRAISTAAVLTSICLFGVYRSSPLSQGLMVEVPKQLIEQVQEHPDTVLIEGKDAEKK